MDTNVTSLADVDITTDNMATTGGQSVPLSYQDQVLEYLRLQEVYGEYFDVDDRFKGVLTISDARKLLDDLLTRVDHEILLKEAYDYMRVHHNQNDLFKVHQFFPEFDMDDQMYDSLCFRENLVIALVYPDESHEPAGGLCIDVQKALGGAFEKSDLFKDFSKSLARACKEAKETNIDTATRTKDIEEYERCLRKKMSLEYDKFLIHASSQFNMGGSNAGSRITTWVDKNFHTLEEKRTEYVQIDPKHVHEKTSYLGISRSHYVLRLCDNREDFCQKFCYTFVRLKYLISEGANFVLMRYLAITKFVGTFELAAIHIEGSLCRNIYECKGVSEAIINDELIEVVTIYRRLIEECGLTHNCVTLLSLDGRILKQEWRACHYALMVAPSGKALLVDKGPVTLGKNWKEDIHLFSKYLDEKTISKLRIKTYLKDHKEILGLISDYVQNVVQIKPENIMNYTTEYFQSYAPYLMPRMEYFEEEQ